MAVWASSSTAVFRLVVVVVAVSALASAGDILFLMDIGSKSHYFVWKRLLVELANRLAEDLPFIFATSQGASLNDSFNAKSMSSYFGTMYVESCALDK